MTKSETLFEESKKLIPDSELIFPWLPYGSKSYGLLVKSVGQNEKVQKGARGIRRSLKK